MASLLEQYEQATATISSRVDSSTLRAKAAARTKNADLQATSTQQQQTQPIFSKQRVDFQIAHGKTIYRMAVSDRLIVLAMKDNTLLRIDLKASPDQIETLDVKSSSPGDGVEDIFLDPSGRNMLLAMRSGECLFYGRTSKKAKVVSRLKTHILTAVGWNYHSLALNGTTGPTLLGTAQGVIFETEFNPNAADSSGVFMASSVDVYWKQVCSLAQPEAVLIKGIFFDRFGKGGDRLSNSSSHMVLIATPTRLYHFKGSLASTSDPPFFIDIFQLDPEKPMTNFLELPGNPRHCCLATWRPLSDMEGVSSFAWLTEPGVYYADIAAGRTDDSVLLNPQLYAFSKDRSNRPVSLVSTEFHVLIQYPGSVRALSKLSGQIIFEDTFTDRYGKLMGICRDASNGAVWLYSETGVYRYKITDESRDVWKIYLEKGDFDSALRYTQSSPSTTNLIRILKAENCLQKGLFELSAEIYAASDAPFEEVALKFSRLHQENALKILLMKKAESLKASHLLPQLFMVSSWLMEIFLNSLGQLKNATDDSAYKAVLLEFRTFLTNPLFLETFQSSSDVFFSLLLSHSADDDYVFLASYLNDVKRLLDFHLERNNFRDVLRLLAVQNGQELIYEFSPRLMRHVPGQLVDIWISKGKSLNPHRLLPSLQRYDNPEMEANEIIRYLEHCIHVLGSQDTALHNYLVTLYCRLRNEDALITYLLTAEEDSTRHSLELYDRKSALRLCVESGLDRASVHLYGVMGLYMEAVELALKFDLTGAKQIAASSDLEESVSKRLWLNIAQHVIRDDRDISKATEILHESGNIIKIEDILPFFPDFVTIDDFKEVICASLEDYNRHISSLKDEVDDATTEAQALRSDIQDYRSHCLYINMTDVCSFCKQPLLTSQIYVFPCKHHLHQDCLLGTLRPHLPSSKRLHIEDLKKQLDILKDHDDLSSVQSFGSANQSISRRDAVKLEIEDMIASECPFCGVLMIKSVDLPFIAPEEYETTAANWL